MNYLKIDLSGIKAGLLHQTSNLRTLIKYCFLNNKRLIKPTFILIGIHNNKVEIVSDLSKYYDLESIKVNGIPYKIYDDNNLEYNCVIPKYRGGLLSNHMFFDISGTYKIRKIDIPYNYHIYEIAKQVTEYFDNDYMCIHVRRGDRIKNDKMNMDLSEDNIKRIIDKYAPKNVYIMTNKINEIKALSKYDNIHFYTDFECLKSICNDNYYLYCVEMIIMKNANIRCSTFRTNIDMYHCCLTDYPGFT